MTCIYKNINVDWCNNMVRQHMMRHEKWEWDGSSPDGAALSFGAPKLDRQWCTTSTNFWCSLFFKSSTWLVFEKKRKEKRLKIAMWKENGIPEFPVCYNVLQHIVIADYYLVKIILLEIYFLHSNKWSNFIHCKNITGLLPFIW